MAASADSPVSPRAVRAWVALLTFGLACTSGTDPESHPVVVLRQVYSFGPCARRWSPSRPPAERTVVDLYFRKLQEGSLPTSQQLALIRVGRGRILYTFNLPIVRAELDVDAVERLVETGDLATTASYARTVAEPARHDVSVFVGLTRAITDADIAAAEALGARVTSRYDSINAYLIDVDDAALPRVRGLPDVRYVEQNGVSCVF